MCEILLVSLNTCVILTKAYLWQKGRNTSVIICYYYSLYIDMESNCSGLKLFPCGIGNDDLQVPSGDDIAAGPIQLTQDFAFFSRRYETLYVSIL